MKKVIVLIVSMFLLTSWQAESAQELRVIAKTECPVSGGVSTQEGLLAAPIAAALLTSVANKLVSAGIDKLTSILNPQDRTLTASLRLGGLVVPQDANLKINPALSCLIIVYGNYGTSPSDLGNKITQAFTQTGVVSKLASDLPLADVPDFYLEAKLKSSPDGTAFTWNPSFVHFGNFFQKNWFAGNDRDIRIQVDLVKPGETKADRSTSWQWTAIRPPMNVKNSVLLPAASWMAVPDIQVTGVSQEKDAAPAKAAPPGPAAAPGPAVAAQGAPPVPAPAAPPGKGAPAEATAQENSQAPYTLNVTLIETANPYTMAKYLAEAMQDNKSTIQSDVVKALVSGLTGTAPAANPSTTGKAAAPVAAASGDAPAQAK